jgi:hypothetical protein
LAIDENLIARRDAITQRLGTTIDSRAQCRFGIRLGSAPLRNC